MPEDAPISTTVPETVTVQTGADKESLGSLTADFADFWKEEDAKQEGAPAAPGEGAGQETQKTEPETKPAAAEVTEEAKSPPQKEVTDEEIDKMETPPHWRPEVVEQVKNLKDLWKADRAKARAETERAAKLETQLQEARANSWTPEAKADYEHAAAIRRKFDFVSDPEFQQKFHAPVRAHFESLLQEAVEVLPDRQAAIAWAQYIAQNYQPDQLDKNWWAHSVIDKVPDEMDRERLRSSVTQLLKMQRERDTEITRRTNDKSSFDNWNQEKEITNNKRVQDEIRAEIEIQEKQVQGILPRDATQAKTKEEREAIEKHNERFNKLNTFFQDTMTDLIAHGPKAWVRASVGATKALLLETMYKEQESELKSAKAERDQLQAELDKITGARRRISSTTGTPPASSGKDKNGGLSIKDLDVRKSFEKFDWGDGS